MDSKAFIDKFISLVERERVLWDKKTDLYGNVSVQNSAWEHIAIQLNESEEGSNVTGASLIKLCSSLLEVHDEYINNPTAISFDHVKGMAFLGKQKKEELFMLKINEKKALFKHIMANVVFLAVYIFLLKNRSFYGYKDCKASNIVLTIGWCASTGLASIATCFIISKDKQFRKNLVSMAISAVYVGIFIIFLLVKFTSSDMEPSECSENIAAVVMAWLAFPISAILSFRYHFVKVSNKSTLISCSKTLAATYFGSALLFILLIANISWAPPFFLFPGWMILNGKFSIDALCLSWKKCNIEPKNRYNVLWNASTDQFEIVLNGTNPNHLPDVLVVTNVEENSEKKCIVIT